MKKALRTAAVALAALTLTGCGQSNQAYYERAQLYLGSGDYWMASALFEQLGEYEDSAEYALYSAGLAALSDGDASLARANLSEVDPFKSSPRYLRYLDAMALEADDDLEGALALYAGLGSFYHSEEDAARLRAEIPERKISYARSLMSAGHYDQALDVLDALDGYGDSAALMAECNQAMTQRAYDQAQQLYRNGAYSDALAAFEALGDTLDARARVLMCRGAMYQQLEESYRAVTLDTAEALLDGYREMEDYLDSEARVKALETRYAVNLSLRALAPERPYAVFGAYPYGESGVSMPLTWRVLAVEDSTATMLCEAVIDAHNAATPTDLSLDINEAAAEPAVSLPSQADLADLPQSDYACAATPYAIAQGVRHHSDGRAWWWLADPLPEGRQPIVWYTGETLPGGVSAEEETVGVRPLLRLSLDRFAFTGGDGSAENPFR